MAHDVEIIFEPLYCARPYGCLCSVCGPFAACVDQQEAEECKIAHQANAEFLEEAKKDECFVSEEITMDIRVRILAHTDVEHSACNLVEHASNRELCFDADTDNTYVLETKDLARAADLLHAIRSVMATAESYAPKK